MPCYFRGIDVLTKPLIRLEPHRPHLLVQLVVGLAARKDAGPVNTPGDVLAGVLQVLLAREAVAVVDEQLGVNPATGKDAVAHGGTPGAGAGGVTCCHPTRRRGPPQAPSRPAPACTPAAAAARTCLAAGRRGWAAAGPAAASRSGSTASAGSRTAPRSRPATPPPAGRAGRAAP